MQLRVSPEAIQQAGVRLAGDGPLLRALAAVHAAARGPAASGAAGHPVLASSLGEFLDCQQAAFTTLAETAEQLARGLGAAAAAYQQTDTRVGLLLGGRR